jgi:hypothetical protein
MPTPMDVQADEFRSAGIPIKMGIKTAKNEKGKGDLPKDFSDIASNTWLLRWARHSAQNYPIVLRSDGVRFLTGACTKIPAFVVGIGPSLDANIEELKRAYRRAIIIATDASLYPLLAKGIKPDIVINFDCQRDQKTLWENLPKNAGDITLIANSCCHPNIFKSYPGPLMFYNQWHKKDVFVDRLLPYIFPHLGDLPSVGTVGNMGIMLASKMGCDPIMTVGMDLCYQKKGDGWQYRCEDYRYGKDYMEVYGWMKRENKTLYDNDERVKRSYEKKIGENVYRIDPELDAYQECLVGLTDGLRMKIIDCSIEGILREYFRNISITQAINEFCTEELSEGRTSLFRLKDLVKDGRKQWGEDSKNGHSY